MPTQAEALRAPGLGARLGGLGSIFGKTIHDSRGAVALVGLGVGLLVFFVASLLATQFPTGESRTEFALQATQMPPLFSGLLGEAIHVERMGGFISWRVLNIAPLVVGAWSVMALAGSLAGEAERGSLEMLVTSPSSRAWIAIQKLLAHVFGMAAALWVVSLFIWAGTLLFATMPGDAVALGDALAHMLWVGIMALTAGSVAFALGPLLGRGGAAGIAAAFLVGSYVVNGYADAIPLLERLHLVSIFAWTAHHRPMAGVSDWASVGLVAVAFAAISAVGVRAFMRRDIGRILTLRLPLPRFRMAVSGAAARSFSERLSAAAWWGIGLAVYVAVFSSNGEDLARALNAVPAMQEFVHALLPGVDITTVSGVLQLAVFNLGTLMMAMVAATLVAGWSGDETERRLESVLTTPLSRWRWTLAASAGVQLALLVTCLLFAAGILLGAAATGADAAQAALGALVVGLYGAALGGIGLAVGGLGWPRLAAGVTAGLAIALFLLDLFGPVLHLPAFIVDLALTRHLGHPMVGIYGWGGIAVAAALAIGGPLISAWGMARRDISG